MIPYNPCGAAVDVIRRPYRTRCRFFADSDQEAEITWYPALDDAPTLPFPSGIVSAEWDVRERENGYPYRTGVGEVWDARRYFVNARPKVAATGQHICGTPEEHADGAAYVPDRPPILYRPDGLPVCCVQGGGVRFGGEARPRPTGGVLYGGEVPRWCPRYRGRFVGYVPWTIWDHLPDSDPPAWIGGGPGAVITDPSNTFYPGYWVLLFPYAMSTWGSNTWDGHSPTVFGVIDGVPNVGYEIECVDY